MEIKLKVIAHDQVPMESEMSAVFGDQGGSIGRAPHNTLILPDQYGYVSRVHANVIKQGEQFSVVDCSSNGTYVFDLEPMSNQHAGEIVLQNSSAPLHVGSHINIGGFEIEVFSVDDDATDRIITQENKPNDATGSALIAPDLPDSIEPVPVAKENYEFESLIGIDPVAESFTPPEINQPAAEKSSSAMPEQFDIDDFFSEQQAPEKVPVADSDSIAAPSSNPPVTPVPVASVSEPSTSEDNTLDVFFKSLGMQPGQYPVDKQLALDHAGKMLRTLLNGTLALTQGRAEFKRQISSKLTDLKKEENNPLKFCQTIDELLPYLFNPQAPGFISPEQAVKQSQDDLLSHQMAVMAGMQAGLMMVVEKFNPAGIERMQSDVRFNKQAKCWEQYVEDFPEKAKQIQKEFFGEQFREAYERQVSKIKEG